MHAQGLAAGGYQLEGAGRGLIDRGYQPAVPLPWFSMFVPGSHSSTCRLENAMMVPASVILKIYVY